MNNEVILVLVNPTSYISIFESTHSHLEIPHEKNQLQKILEAFESLGVQVYFSDLGMPMKDGFKVASLQRALK